MSGLQIVIIATYNRYLFFLIVYPFLAKKYVPS